MTRIFDSRTTQRAGRPMARPVSVRAQTVDGRPMRYRTLCKEIPCPYRDTQHATPFAGLTYRARTGVRPRGGSLPPSDGPDPRPVLPGAMAGPTPSAGNSTTSVVGGCQHGTSPIEIDEPVLPDADNEIHLKRIFHWIEQEGQDTTLAISACNRSFLSAKSAECLEIAWKRPRRD